MYADLATTDADTVLAGWLRALGTCRIPHRPDELRAQWRTVTSHRKLLVVVDNTTAGDAVDLLPVGPDCAGIATSRAGMTDLVASGARVVPLAPLSAEETRHLISRLTPGTPDQAVLDAAVASSWGHPLTAVLTAAYLARHPSTTPEQLTHRQETSMVDDRVTRILTGLPAPVERAARLLAVHPGPHLPLGLAVSVLGTSTDDTRAVLHALVDAELLTDLGGARWTHHQVIAEAVRCGLDPELRDQAVDAIGQYYRVRSAAAGKVINPWRWRIDEVGVGLAEDLQSDDDPWFVDRDAAIGWLDTEMGNLRAVARFSADAGRHDTVWQLADHTSSYATLRKPWALISELYPAALECAQQVGNLAAEGLMRQLLARTNEDWEQALDHAKKALALYQRTGYAPGVASAYESLGTAHREGGDLDQAAEEFERSVELHLRLNPPRRRGAALQSRKLAEVRIWQNRPAEALTALRRARNLLLSLEVPDRYQGTRCLQAEVQAHRALGDPDEAEQVAYTALDEARATGGVHQEATVHVALADIARDRGHHDQEVAQLTQALQLLKPTGHPDTERVQNRLAAMHITDAE
ncbi:hypothetical protein BJF83_22870 [Nocardiopsis sp. CNR-923]|uniref:tetratricopeptide repeat protein n=1 Tax=Nocardiopsis sp. CNR-923 TaxID=1904965 RepID=UPI00096035CE|nr:tetratricopeptide repeat protein [Nocardiopsis sp. CNR-923]OLT25404.1 hypothetical protein BJF83_22870 [Nocardiopsis sp. CNR-923]